MKTGSKCLSFWPSSGAGGGHFCTPVDVVRVSVAAMLSWGASCESGRALVHLSAEAIVAVSP